MRRGLVGALALALLGTTFGLALPAAASGPNVLLVGPAGTAGAQFSSIQAAVNAAQPGDWVLVAPGVYHEKGYSPTTNPNGKPTPAEVQITTPNLHLRGMNRDTVIVDGTNFSASQAAGTAPAGSAACSSDPTLQDPGVKQSGGNTQNRDGIVVWRTSGVSIENLTSCNSLSNEIWWNQGDGTGQQAPMAASGDYISATSTFYSNARSAQYGIFTSDVEGPAIIDHSYANNMTDSSYYVGACRNCNTTLEHPHAEYSALGLSSTNAGGNLIIENGEWDNNRTGLVSNAQNNDDWPSPEYGQCVLPSVPPAGAGPNSCYVIRGNYIHDNNNNNTPGQGLTAVSGVGTGVELAATQHISVVNNRIENNGSWGVVTHDFPDPETGPAGCQGGVFDPTHNVCLWYSRGNYVANNKFLNNGGNGNASNGDIANQASGALDASACPQNNTACTPAPNADPNCFASNSNSGSGGLSEWPAMLQEAPCPPGLSDPTVLTAQLVCATGAASLFTMGLVNPPACPMGANYPQHDGNCTAPGQQVVAADDPNTKFCFLPLSYTLSAAISPPMPDPCAGVPANAFCQTASMPPLPGTSTARGLSVTALLLAILGSGVLVSAVAWGRRRRRIIG
ncbi:MAG TPA: hypothetical protein VNV65_02195 [Candidatus Solibacter sp.]|nr:hypothetical protein [Candidatus Solibacter sp.]